MAVPHTETALYEISLCSKGRVYQAMARSILLYGCEAWLARAADERTVEAFDIRRVLFMRRRNWWNCGVPSTCIPAQLVQRRVS